MEALGPSESASRQVEVTAPAVGTYYYGACVDSVPGETDTTNNCIGAVKVTVVDPAIPDLIVQPPRLSSSTVDPGDSFTLIANVWNAAG